MAWIIKGEAGKTLDDTSRAPTVLNIESHSLGFRSMAADRYAWTAATSNTAGAGTIIPEVGQVVSLWDGSTRVFRGWCAKPMRAWRLCRTTDTDA